MQPRGMTPQCKNYSVVLILFSNGTQICSLLAKNSITLRPFYPHELTLLPHGCVIPWPVKCRMKLLFPKLNGCPIWVWEWINDWFHNLYDGRNHFPDSKVHVANMGLTWVLSAPDGPHVGPMNLVTKVVHDKIKVNPCLWLLQYKIFVALQISANKHNESVVHFCRTTRKSFLLMLMLLTMCQLWFLKLNHWCSNIENRFGEKPLKLNLLEWKTANVYPSL